MSPRIRVPNLMILSRISFIILTLGAFGLISNACGLEVKGLLSGTQQSSSGSSMPASSSSSGGGGAGGTAGMGGNTSAGGSMAQCGNGMVEAGEQCDDGNTNNDDGCSSQCGSEAIDSCPGAPILLAPGTKELAGNTSIANNEYLPSECGDMIGKGNEYVYAITPSAGGTLTIQLESTFSGVLYARRECAGPYFDNQLGCSHAGNSNELKLWVFPGLSYYIFVDGENNIEDGAYTLKLNLSECGNGQVEGLEQCDKASDPGCVGCISCKGKDEIFESPDSKFENSPSRHCYWHDAGNSINWLDARRACLAWGGDLVSISSWQEGNFLNGFINADTWTGANDIALEDQYEWSSGEALRFLNWNSSEPNNFGNEDCAFMNGETRLVDDKCATANHPYLCERVPQGQCGDGIIQGAEECDDQNAIDSDGCTQCIVDCNAGQNGEYKHPLSHHCYRIETMAPKIWSAAAADCAAWGGELAAINNKYENAFLADKLMASNVYAWTGGSDQSAEGQFMWANGEPVLYTSWSINEPNNQGEEDCIQVGPAGFWNDFPCGQSIPYICERIPAGIH